MVSRILNRAGVGTVIETAADKETIKLPTNLQAKGVLHSKGVKLKNFDASKVKAKP